MAKDTQPNILLLLTDQERYDMSSPNGPDVETDNINRLQAEGMRFERAYTPIGICSSARSSLLTGLYPHNHGMINNCHEPDAIRENLPKEHPTFSERLLDSGYENTYIGKWHVGRSQQPEDFGFDYLGGGDGHHDSVNSDFKEYQRQFDIDPEDIELEDTIYADYGDDQLLISAKTPIPKEATRTHYIAEKTIERLKEWDSSEGPFFHRSDFVGPHHPYVVPEPYASMYDPADIEIWENFDDSLEDKPEVQKQFLKYRGVEDFDRETWLEAISKYFGFVSFIDDEMGRILDTMDELGIDDDTLVIHAADHGDFTGSHRQFNKGPLMYEEVYHIPLVVRWPNVVEPGSVNHDFVRLLDLMPTFLDVADLEIPDGIDGRSILPLLQGETPTDWPDSVFAEYHGEEFGLYSQRMVRTSSYKFIYNGPGKDELYNLERDPHELENLIEHPAHQDARQELEEKLVDWMEETDDTIQMWPSKILGSE